MRRSLSILCLILVTCSMLIQTVDAKRFGGGRSFGYQRSASSFSRPTPTTAPAPQAPSTANKWLGPLAGLAAGGLLASLFMGHGISNGIMSWILLLGGAMLVWSFIRNRLNNKPLAPQFSQQHAPLQPLNNVIPFAPVTNNTSSAPLGFDSAAMLRDAKVQFIRLQAAYDTKNLADLREFTTPEVFAEAQLQIQERGDIENKTEVVMLEAELLDVVSELQFTYASVHFSGLIRENPADEPAAFKEIWHFRKTINETKWLVAGLEQE